MHSIVILRFQNSFNYNKNTLCLSKSMRDYGTYRICLWSPCELACKAIQGLEASSIPILCKCESICLLPSPFLLNSNVPPYTVISCTTEFYSGIKHSFTHIILPRQPRVGCALVIWSSSTWTLSDVIVMLM